MNINNAFAAKPQDFPALVAAWQLSEQQTQRRRSIRLYRAEHIEGLNPLQRYLIFINIAQLSRFVAGHKGILRQVDPTVAGKTGLFGQLCFDNTAYAAIYTNEHAPAMLTDEFGFSIVQLDRS